MRRLGRLVGLALLSGCYAYAPIARRATVAGSSVRVTLSDAGALAVSPLIGGSVDWIEGEVREATDSGMTVALRTVRRRDSGESTWNGEMIPLRGVDVESVSTRTLSRARTATALTMLSAAGVALIYGIAHALGAGAGGPGGGPPDPP